MRHARLPMRRRGSSAAMRSAAPAACCRLRRLSWPVKTDCDRRGLRNARGATREHQLGWLLTVALAVAPALATSSNAGSAAVADAASERGGAVPAAAPKSTTFEVPRHVIAGGGGHSSGGNFAIEGSIGQAEVDPLQPSSGGAYAITGGFWFDAELLDDLIFADGFETL